MDGDLHSNRVSSNRSLFFRETEFCAQRQRPQNIQRSSQRAAAEHGTDYATVRAATSVQTALRQRRQVDRSHARLTRNSSPTIIRSPLPRKITLRMSRGIND
jgi:hypothetical protein